MNSFFQLFRCRIVLTTKMIFARVKKVRAVLRQRGRAAVCSWNLRTLSHSRQIFVSLSRPQLLFTCFQIKKTDFVYLLTHCLLSYLGICKLSSSVTSHQWLLYHDCSLFMRESPNIFCGGTRYFLLWLRAASRLSCVCADRRLLAPALRLSGTGGRREAAGCGWCGAPWAGVSSALGTLEL